MMLLYFAASALRARTESRAPLKRPGETSPVI
jgi:hypothetical protein